MDFNFMWLPFKDLKKISVETASGVRLGQVHDLVLEIDGQLVAQYLIKPSVVSRTMYRVSRDQVIKFTEEKMIVDDGVVKENGRFVLEQKSIAETSGAVAMTSDD
jgi:sporulation protein YlmC with PRC-barrel domain